MYGELLQVKMHYNDESKELTMKIFNQLVGVSGELKFTKDRQQYFDLQDFILARKDFPELFEWLDYPEQYIQQFLK